jgi:hypothetical protein
MQIKVGQLWVNKSTGEDYLIYNITGNIISAYKRGESNKFTIDFFKDNFRLYTML